MDKEVSYVCYLCTVNFSSRQTRRKVYKPVSSFVCVECSKPFKEGFEVTDKEEPPYACKKCDKVYQSRSGLKSHSYEHSNVWPHYCEVCGKGWATESRLRRHKVQQHSEERLQKCNVCSSVFKKKHRLVEHMQLHDNSNPLRCEQCNRRCLSKYHLKIHMAVHSDERPFECIQCHSTYKHLASLNAHIKDYHKDGE